jgi:hypothetical protein
MLTIAHLIGVHGQEHQQDAIPLIVREETSRSNSVVARTIS